MISAKSSLSVMSKISGIFSRKSLVGPTQSLHTLLDALPKRKDSNVVQVIADQWFNFKTSGLPLKVSMTYARSVSGMRRLRVGYGISEAGIVAKRDIKEKELPSKWGRLVDVDGYFRKKDDCVYLLLCCDILVGLKKLSVLVSEIKYCRIGVEFGSKSDLLSLGILIEEYDVFYMFYGE